MTPNGWTPRLRADGLIASGNAGIWLTGGDVGSFEVSPVGIGPIWAGTTLVYYRQDGNTDVGGVPIAIAYNGLVGSDDGRWAGFFAPDGGRVDVYLGTVLQSRLPLACAPLPLPDLLLLLGMSRSASSVARSVRSHVNVFSVRPKWPYAAVAL